MFRVLVFSVVLLFLLSACATNVGGYVVPGVQLQKDGRYFIKLRADDERGLGDLLQSQLESQGAIVNVDEQPAVTDVDYIVEYGGQWQWDITWYLLNFDVRIFDAQTGLFVASASSLRTSIVRKEPSLVVDETLQQLFKQ